MVPETPPLLIVLDWDWDWGLNQIILYSASDQLISFHNSTRLFPRIGVHVLTGRGARGGHRVVMCRFGVGTCMWWRVAGVRGRGNGRSDGGVAGVVHQ